MTSNDQYSRLGIKMTSHLVNGEVWEQCLRLLGGNRCMDDSVISLLPIHRRDKLVLVCQLKSYDSIDICPTAALTTRKCLQSTTLGKKDQALHENDIKASPATHRRISSKLRPVDAG